MCSADVNNIRVTERNEVLNRFIDASCVVENDIAALLSDKSQVLEHKTRFLTLRFFDQSLGYFDGRCGDWFIRCDDPDAAEPVWTKPERFADGCTLNKPTVLSNGDWLIPVSLWTRDRMHGPGVDKEAHKDLDAILAELGYFIDTLLFPFKQVLSVSTLASQILIKGI